MGVRMLAGLALAASIGLPAGRAGSSERQPLLYTNEAYGFEMEYPGDWIVVDRAVNSHLFAKLQHLQPGVVCRLSKDHALESPPILTVNVREGSPVPPGTLEEWADGFNQITAARNQQTGLQVMTILPAKVVELGGRRLVTYTERVHHAPYGRTVIAKHYVFFQPHRQVVIIAMVAPAEEPKYAPIIQAMIESVRLLDVEQR